MFYLNNILVYLNYFSFFKGIFFFNFYFFNILNLNFKKKKFYSVLKCFDSNLNYINFLKFSNLNYINFLKCINLNYINFFLLNKVFYLIFLLLSLIKLNFKFNLNYISKKNVFYSFFNKIKLNLIVNKIKFNFIKKFNFNINIKLRSLKLNFLNFFSLEKKFSKKKFFFRKNLKNLILNIFFSIIFKNGDFFIKYIFNFFSFIEKDHKINFRNLIEIIKFLYINKFLKIKGLFLKIKGKINGSRRKKKLSFYLGKVPLNYFKNKVYYKYLFKNTLFGSLSIKLWLVFY